MTMDKQIKRIIEEAIPLNPTCEVERKREIERRAKLRIDIESLLRVVVHFEPRTEIK